MCYYFCGMKNDEKRITTDDRRTFKYIYPRHHGYIEVELGPDDFELRKINPHQRQMVILYYIKLHDGEKIMFDEEFAIKLGAKQRIIQYDLAFMEKKGWIRIEPTFDKKGRNSYNRYWNMVRKEAFDHFYGMKPTIARVYSVKNFLGLRNWHWEDYKVIMGYDDSYHTKWDKIENYDELRSKRKDIKQTLHAYDLRKLSPYLKRQQKQKTS